jgi:hypothetical protein
MQKQAFIVLLLAVSLLAGSPARAQSLFYNTSSTVLSQNTVQQVATNGNNNSLVFTATGPGLNNVYRCTALAVDAVNSQLFLLDGVSNAIWSLNLTGGSLTLVKSGLTNFPTDLALDVVNKKIYYTTSSTIQNNNTVQRVDYSGNNHAVIYTATGTEEDANVSRCTAIALDPGNSKIFIADVGTRTIWSMNLSGGGVVALDTFSNTTPTSLALDVNNRQIYFTLSSTVQSSNLIERMNYDGSGLITIFTASGGVQRCTALDLDLAHDNIFLSDARANALFRIPLSGGSPTVLLTELTSTAKRIRFYAGPQSTSLVPFLTSFSFIGANLILNASNGVAGNTYFVLTSTNLTAPLSQWSPIASNVLTASGLFTITATNAASKNTPHQFFILRGQ